MLPAVLLKKLCSSPSLCSSKISKIATRRKSNKAKQIYQDSKCSRKASDRKLFLSMVPIVAFQLYLNGCYHGSFSRNLPIFFYKFTEIFGASFRMSQFHKYISPSDITSLYISNFRTGKYLLIVR